MIYSVAELKYLYFWGCPEFIYGIFKLIFVSMRPCVRVCMIMNNVTSAWHTHLSSNLLCTLKITVGQTIMILVNIKLIFFFMLQKLILMHFDPWSQVIKSLLVSKQCIWFSSNSACTFIIWSQSYIIYRFW